MTGAAISRWTMSYFTAALMSLLIGGALTASGFGYPSVPLDAPETLVVVHIVAIGWLGLLFCGALLQFVPVLVAKSLRAAWVAAPALVAIIIGLACLIAGFLAMGDRIDASLGLLPFGAAVLLVGFGALIAVFGLTLVSARPLSVPARLVAVGLGSLAITVMLGLAFSIVLSGADVPTVFSDLLGIGVPFHAAFGLLGWMTLTALGVSYRLFTMFMLAPEGGKATGRWVLWLAVLALVALAVSLCAKVGDLPPFAYIPAVAIGLTLAAVAVYCRDIVRIYRARRRKTLELNISTSLIALGFLVAGLVALVSSGFVEQPDHLTASAIYLLIFGWLSGLGLGQLYKIVPFLTWLECYGPVMGKTPVPRVQDLVNERRAALWFWLYFVAVAFGSVFLFLGSVLLFRFASACQMMAVAGLIFEYIQARRLSCASPAIRLPKGAIRPHLIIPHIQTRR